jgi:DNA-binding response OmpR family regulator
MTRRILIVDDEAHLRTHRQRGVAVGADLYMTKPFDPDALLGKARDVLGL